MRLRLGTRRSALAMAQSELVADQLRELGHEVELVRIVTEGDVTRGSLTQLAGLGVFAAALRQALLDGRCDFAVHSMKDLPVAPVPGLQIAAVPRRANPFDVLCARDGLTLDELPSGARIGSGSPRRVAQLRAIRPDLEFVDIRGNVGTRLARVAPDDLDAVILAAAGLQRLGMAEVATEVLPILPAPGQGALALECRAADDAVLAALTDLNDAATHEAVAAERTVLALLGGGCAAPIAAHAADGKLDAVVCALDGARQARASLPLQPRAAELVVEELLGMGAASIADLAASRPSRLEELHDDADLWRGAVPLGGLRILLTTSRQRLADQLRAAGAEVDAVDFQKPRPLADLPEESPAADWVVFTSPTSPQVVADLGWRLPAGARVAAVGAGTARAVQEILGAWCDLVPAGSAAGAQALLDIWPSEPENVRVLIPGSVDSASTLADGLRARGAEPIVLPIYRMQPVTQVCDDVSNAWQLDDFDAVVVTAGSAGRALHELLGWRDDVAVIAFGEPTATALQSQGLRVDEIAQGQDAAAVAQAIQTAIKAAPIAGESSSE